MPIKLNEGNIMEGIFAIAIAYLLKDGKIDKKLVNDTRVQIEPAMFKDAKSIIPLAKNVKRSKPGKLPDYFNVNLEIRMKPKGGVDQAFGGQFEAKYAKGKDVGQIDKKLEQIIKAGNAKYSTKLINIRDNFLDNNVGDVVTFTIICDGISGESSGGDIKGDVFVKIVATTGKGGQKTIFNEELSFSLKSNSNTFGNLTPYGSSIYLLKLFGITIPKNFERFEFLETLVANNNEKKEIKLKGVRAVFENVQRMVCQKVKGDKASSKKAFEFLGKQIFGSDNAHLVEILPGTIKEMSREYFELLMKDTILYAEGDYSPVKPEEGLAKEGTKRCLS